MGGWDTLRGIESRKEGRIFFAHGLHGGLVLRHLEVGKI